MVYRGRVENGVIRLDGALLPADGTEVEVRFLAGENAVSEVAIPSLYERLKDLVGKAEGLPADASVNLDHYLYGTPRQS
jgi:hypothetical protein